MTSFFNEFFDFYNTNLKKKHIIVYVISLVIFFLFLAVFISSIDVTNSIERLAESSTQAQVSTIKDILSTIFKQTLPAIFLVIFAGITPFVYLSFIGFGYSYVLALDIANAFVINPHTYNVILMTIGGIIQIFAISLAIVTGFYYCGLSTKKFRYSQRSGFGLYDFKKQVYSLKNQKEKIEKLDEAKRKKDEKTEKLNQMIKEAESVVFQVFVVAFVIAVIGTIISAI